MMPFNILYPVAADYDFIIKLIEKNLSYTMINFSLVNFRLEGVSSQIDLEKHKLQVRLQHFGYFIILFDNLLKKHNKYITFILLKLLSLKKYMGKNYEK